MPTFNIQLRGQGTTPDHKKIDVPPQAALQHQGPMVPVSVCLEQNAAKPILQKGGAVLGAPGMALIDTGASLSAIDEDLANELKIPIIDQGKTDSATHRDHPCNLYPVQFTIGNVITVQVPRAMGVKLRHRGYIAIIGRDILQGCILIYNGGMGSISLSM
jgi:hypothetical protein